MSDREVRVKRMKEMILKNQESKVKVHSGLFLECIEALGIGTKVLSEQESECIYDELQRMFNFTQWGRIDWDKVEHKVSISDVSEIVPNIKLRANISCPVFILWGYGEEPVIQTTIENVVQSIDDVTAVGGDQWVYSSQGNYVVELYHEGELTIGFLR